MDKYKYLLLIMVTILTVGCSPNNTNNELSDLSASEKAAFQNVTQFNN